MDYGTCSHSQFRILMDPFLPRSVSRFSEQVLPQAQDTCWITHTLYGSGTYLESTCCGPRSSKFQATD